MLERYKRQLAGAGVAILVITALWAVFGASRVFDIQTMGIGSEVNSVASAETIQWDTTYSDGNDSPGLLFWDDTEQTLALNLAEGTGATAQLAQEQHVYARNNTGSVITDGLAVYVTGATGNRPTISLAKADAVNTSYILGVATHDIANNANGYVTTFGIVRDIDTSDHVEGAILYLSDSIAGGLTSTVPSTGYLMQTAVVLRSHAMQGAILVRPHKRPVWGNIPAGNYSYFEPGGTLVFSGTATVWDDLRVPLSQGAIAGANVPAFEEIASSGTYAYNFDDDDEIWFTAQMPHGYKLESTIEPHVHWGPETDVEPSDNVGLGLECSWTAIGGDVDSSTTYTREVPTGVDNQYAHLIHNVPTAGWDGTGIDTLSSIINCRLYRFAASTDNYGAGIFIYEVDFHYEIDTVGSREAETK